MPRAVLLVVAGLVATLTLAGCTAGGPSAVGASSGPSSAGPSTTASASPTPALDRAGVDRSLRALEQEYDATVGVVATEPSTGRSIAYNGGRRFGYASTLKVFAAAEFLRTVHGADRDARAHWTAADTTAAGYSPVTSQHLDDGLGYAQLAEAAVRQSDNTALDLVLDRIGGPRALDDALARLGDTTTEVVHTEPDLNTVEPGSTDDTTTPAAFTADLARILDGRTLGAADTALLVDWMSGNATGDTLIRAGAPEGWTVADKSGGAGGIRNDVARATRPDGRTVVISVLTARNDPAARYDDALVAKAAATVLQAFRAAG